MARMAYEIAFAPEAAEDLRELKARWRAEVLDGIEKHLRHEPMKTSQSRIKRLQGVRRPQYRLRLGELRVLYDVSGRRVEILGIVFKPEVHRWLEQFGEDA